ncbi:MAG: DNA methyltransferase [Oscillospiraceae bacterium]
MTEKEMKSAAKAFAEYWQDKGDEKQETARFWIELLSKVLGVEEPTKFIEFEKPVMVEKNQKYIDGYIPSTKILIEQKGSHVKLGRTAVQSDGEKLTPYGQAFRYNNYLPYDQKAKFIIVSNFREILIYNMNKPNGEPEQILLKDLPKECYRLKFLVDTGSKQLKKEMEISLQAGEIVGKLYDAILGQYKNPDDPETLKSLNKLCVRLVFCLYAEDAGIFGKHGMFHDYLKQFPAKNVRNALVELFRVLDTKDGVNAFPNERDPYLNDDLAAFPYVNGGLFRDEDIEIPHFTEEIMTILLEDASAEFNWSGISPTIFGAVFESTLNPETRRSGGMHYTSIENIHKVIDPLFLDALKAELEDIKALKVEKTRQQKLRDFRKKLSTLVFLDPAAGSGNFLTETYISLRRLENDALFEETHGQMMLGNNDVIQVSISQFYGIEINDFAVTVAKTALWIAESQMMQETESLMQIELNFLPLKSYANIVEGNALRLDWERVVPKDRLNYIMFVGASMMNKEQKKEAVEIFGKIKLSNSIDYVGAWYFKACELMKNTTIKTALVSTNSITQGEQVAPLWGTLFERYDIQINFAHRTFRWDSEANLKAHVHCVIIGFGMSDQSVQKRLYDGEQYKVVNNINAYLLEAPNVFISSRSKPICDVPKLTKGNQPTDDGNFILSEEEKEQLLKNDSTIACCVRRYVGARDFLNNNEIRYCLWLKGISPSVYRKNKEIARRLNAIKEFREKSTAAPTRKFAEKPYLFFSAPHNDCRYLIVPRVSSEKRKYIPIGFMPPDIIAADSCSIIPNATLYEFGILMSNVHNAWMRAVAGRLEMRYRYSGSVVYNNFPWCSPTPEQKAKIEKTAQAILDARAMHPNCSLADLYDETTMPPELRKAHQQNDFAVMAAYGFDRKMAESECVAELMKLYQKLTAEDSAKQSP